MVDMKQLKAEVSERQIRIANLNKSIEQAEGKKKEIEEEISKINQFMDTGHDELPTKYLYFDWDTDGGHYSNPVLTLFSELSSGVSVGIGACATSTDPYFQLSWMKKQCDTYNLPIPTKIYRELQLRVYRKTASTKWESMDERSYKEAIELVSSRSSVLFGDDTNIHCPSCPDSSHRTLQSTLETAS